MEETRTYSAGARAAEVGARILIALEAGGVETWILPRRGTVTIGRDPSNDVCILHPSVEARHAVLELADRVVFRAVGGGAALDGIAILAGEAADLALGATLTLGAVTLVLQVRGAGALPDEPPPATIAIGDHDACLGGAFAGKLDVLRKVARGDITVLVVGETGVGKDVVAELLHRASPRARGPFVRVHCAALAATLFESELFGHERGAFTGATGKKEGLVALASGGTLFLDEVGEIPPAMQVKLLRVLEDRRVTPVGGTAAREVDVRFVAATNRDLVHEVAEGRFREDLYYRLAGFTVAIPPLRERGDEILPLARHFLARAHGGSALSLDASAERALLEHPFPGNVRELRLAVERAAALSTPPRVTATDLALEPAGDGARSEPTARVLETLAACAGNQSEAARRLGISRRTLVSKLSRARGNAH